MQEPSLKRLLLVYELAFVLLLSVAGGLGGLWAYFWNQTTRESVRISQMYYAAQQVRGDLFRQIKEVYLAQLMQEKQAVSTYTGYSRRIDAHFATLNERMSGDTEAAATTAMRDAYQTIQRDMNNIFADPYLINRATEVRILDPGQERNFVAAFEEAFREFEDLMAARQQTLEEKMARWTRLAPALIVLSLLLAGLLVFASRRAVQRRVVEPLSAVISGARRISAGELDTRIEQSGVSEAQELSRTLNDMASKLAASQEALLDAERQAAMGSLVPVVAHNIRNPLATIRATAQLIDEGDNAEDLREARDGIVGTVDRLGRWVTSLVSYLHPLKPHLREAVFAEFAQAVIDLLRERLEEKNITIVREPWDGSLSLEVDPDLMEQALYALLSNAIDASPVNGEIRLGLQAQDGQLHFSIVDEGPGMPFQPEPRELEPGPTTKRFGTGLGIPVAFKVCRAHGWQLSFDSAGQGGTQVTIRAAISES